MGSGDGAFQNPVSVCTTTSNVYVLDSTQGRVQVFSKSGVFQTAFGSTGYLSGQFVTPVAIAAAPDGTVVVLDQQLSVLKLFDRTGRFLGAVGKTGSDNGEFTFATGVVATAPTGPHSRNVVPLRSPPPSGALKI